MIRGVTITANRGRINTDGIDPDGCRNVIISDCRIETGDDCIVIKSTEGDPCENITVANCVLSSSHAALKIGTEAIGDIRNMTFNNCVIRDTDVALALYMKDGSTYENMVFSNMVIEAGGEFPILLDVTPRYYREPKIGRIRNILFDNLVVTGPGRVFMEGMPGRPIEDVRFRDVLWNVTGRCRTEGIQKPPGARRVEIDPDRINYAVHPYQFIAAHVDGLTLRDIRIKPGREGYVPDRGQLYAERVERLAVERVEAFASPEGIPPVRFPASAAAERA
jgi:hypothetical protein